MGLSYLGWFEVLRCIINIYGTLINESSIRVGKGAGEFGEVDLPIERDVNGVPYMPGSSLKGCIRSLSEALARASKENICDPLTVKNICNVATAVIKKAINLSTKGKLLEEIKKEISKVFKDKGFDVEANAILTRQFKDINELINHIINNYGPCIICRIFGNTELASHIYIYDSYPAKELINKVTALSRTRVAIDRFRNASRSGALFTYEYIPQGYRWDFKMRIINIDILKGSGKEVNLLRSVIKYMTTHGLVVGSMKTVGHGLLRLDPDNTFIERCYVEGLKIVCEPPIKLSEVIKEW